MRRDVLTKHFMPTAQDVGRMLQVASTTGKEQEVLILTLLSKIGLNETELTGEKGHPGLRVGDIDFDRNAIRIVGIMRDAIPVDAETLKLIRTYIDQKGLKTHDRLIPLFKKDLRELISDLAVEAKIIPPTKKRGKHLLWAPSDDDVDALQMTAVVLARKYKQMKSDKQRSKKFRDYLLARIMAFTAIRECEAVGNWHLPGIRVEDINYERKVIKIYPKGLGNYAEVKEKDLDDDTLDLLANYVQLMKLQPTQRIFQLSTRQAQRVIKNLAIQAEDTIKRCKNKECRTLTAIEETTCPSCQNSEFEPVKVAYAKHFAPHRLRAYAITKVEDSTDIYKAAKFAGQKDTRTTQRYAFESHEQRRRIFEETFLRKNKEEKKEQA